MLYEEGITHSELVKQAPSVNGRTRRDRVRPRSRGHYGL